MRTTETGIISDCNKTIAALRKQIKETKDAMDMDMDMDMLEKTKETVVAKSMELEKELQTRVKLGGARGGRVKLGACAPGSLPLSLPSRDDEAVVEDKKLHAGTFTGIVGLRKELDALRKAHAPCAGTLQARDDQIKELKAHLARLDKTLAGELEKEAALVKELAEEKCKEAELEKSLAQEQSNVMKTRAELAKDEKDLAEDVKVLAMRDSQVAHLKVQLLNLQDASNSSFFKFVLLLFSCESIFFLQHTS
jgi:chromosome segregation ATPase